jgi:hypothetical protein
MDRLLRRKQMALIENMSELARLLERISLLEKVEFDWDNPKEGPLEDYHATGYFYDKMGETHYESKVTIYKHVSKEKYALRIYTSPIPFSSGGRVTDKFIMQK